ncbi:MAG: C45 family peptidase [Myxococcota bacterium]|nr:C45 family peptidase [Myxococcota bacterium]
MAEEIKLDIIDVAGTASIMGQKQGEALRTRIHEFIEVRMAAVHQYAKDRGRRSADGILDVGRQSLEIYAQWDPDGYTEHVGIATGANVDPVLLYTSTNMTDMRDALLLKDGVRPPVDDEGCSSLLIPSHMTKDGLAIVGQTWDLNPPDIEYVVAIRRRPDSGLETWSVTCAGCLTLMGLNSSGVAVGTTNIKTYGSKPGVGYLSVLHRMLRSHTTKQASHRLLSAPRSGAHVFWVADPTDLREYETTPDSAILREPIDAAVCHTNHCLHETHIAKQAEACSSSSDSRLNTINQLLAAGDHDIESVKNVFADRSKGFDSINRYPEDDQGTATNSVFIARPAQREAYACRGPADRGQWYHLTF